MKNNFSGLRSFSVVLSALILISSCSKSNSGSGSGSGGIGNGSFSVTLNGNAISGTSATNNADVIIKADPNANFTPDGDIFLTMQVSGDTIGFHLPDRTGSILIAPTSPAHIYGVFNIPNSTYFFDSVTVNVTTLTSSRIKGTFSGRLSTSLLQDQGTRAEMTNGSFDLPLLE